jgi:phage shock protein C
MIAGVCGGLGDYFSIDPTLIRIIFVIAVLAGFGSGLVAYVILALIVPEEPAEGYEPPPPPTAPEEYEE